MDDLQLRANTLQQQIDAACKQLGIDSLHDQEQELTNQSQQPNFWSDAIHAQQVMKRIAELQARTKPWLSLRNSVADLSELIGMDDDRMADELGEQLGDYQLAFEQLKGQLSFNGPFDDHNAIVSIYAGAGGKDAQDWAQMLLRMYLRWAEANKYKTEIIEESPGEEAGIKSATISIAGQQIFGKLKGEHGVHRLVRQSPFNSAASRETSFAKVDVLPEIDHPGEVEVDDKDLKVDVYRSGGHGGQSVNTTDSAVRITHLPTGISVAIQNERSQLQNKEMALTILRSRLAQLQLEQHAEKISELKGPDSANEFGSQIRNYVLHPYKQVKDLRSGYETSDPDAILNGNLNPLIEAYLEHAIGQSNN